MQCLACDVNVNMIMRDVTPFITAVAFGTAFWQWGIKSTIKQWVVFVFACMQVHDKDSCLRFHVQLQIALASTLFSLGLRTSRRMWVCCRLSFDATWRYLEVMIHMAYLLNNKMLTVEDTVQWWSCSVRCACIQCVRACVRGYFITIQIMLHFLDNEKLFF